MLEPVPLPKILPGMPFIGGVQPVAVVTPFGAAGSLRSGPGISLLSWVKTLRTPRTRFARSFVWWEWSKNTVSYDCEVNKGEMKPKVIDIKVQEDKCQRPLAKAAGAPPLVYLEYKETSILLLGHVQGGKYYGNLLWNVATHVSKEAVWMWEFLLVELLTLKNTWRNPWR